MRAKFNSLLLKQIDSMLPCICPVIDHRGGQNVVRTSVANSAIVSCAPFFSHHILTSSVIYYCSDARQHGIYLLNRQRVRVITLLKIGTLRKDDENADADVDQRKPRTTHAQYGQPRFRHVLPRRPERENPTFAVLWRTSVYLLLFLQKMSR